MKGKKVFIEVEILNTYTTLKGETFYNVKLPRAGIWNNPSTVVIKEKDVIKRVDKS